MKTNLPVTGQAVTVPANTYLVSQTDLKGVITDANEAFIAVSGFSLDELVGKSHNLVRHPDMPPVVFADLWRSLKAGQPWRGVVKNRCKNGDHYWVRAAVIPIGREGQTVGYMSVRRAASSDEIRNAEALYSTLRQGNPAFSSVPAHIKTETRFNWLLSIQSALILALSAEALGLPTARWLTFLIVALAVLVSFYLIWALRSQVWGALEQIHERISLLAKGDMSQRYPIRHPDAIGRLGNELTILQTSWLVQIDLIRRALNDVEKTLAIVQSQTQTIRQHLKDEDERIMASAAATEEFCQAVAEVSSTAELSATSAGSAEAQLAAGVQHLSEGMHAVAEVEQNVEISHALILDLNRAANEIGKISETIHAISDQTNLLALNASIEAARAGESGRGFSVVADEVRKLAEHTGTSTMEIASALNNVQSLSTKVVAAMDTASQTVRKSSGILREGIAGLEQVSSTSRESLKWAESIAGASHEQTASGQEVAQNMEHISRLAEENERKVEELAEAMTQLQAATQKIEVQMRIFKM